MCVWECMCVHKHNPLHTHIMVIMVRVLNEIDKLLRHIEVALDKDNIRMRWPFRQCEHLGVNTVGCGFI